MGFTFFFLSTLRYLLAYSSFKRYILCHQETKKPTDYI